MRVCKLLGVLCLLVVTGCPSFDQFMRSYGFKGLRPPSTLLNPGTIVYVQKKKNPFQAGIVCEAKDSLGPSFVSLLSQTSESSLLKKAGTSFNLGAEYMDLVHAKAQFKVIRGMSVTFRNPIILTLTDTQVVNHINQRTPACSAAIAARRAAGFEITMIKSALRADAEYSVTFENDVSLDVGAKVALLQNLGVSLGMSDSHVTDHTIEGRSLYWGIQDDAYLASIGEYSGFAEGPREGLFSLLDIEDPFDFDPHRTDLQ